MRVAVSWNKAAFSSEEKPLATRLNEFHKTPYDSYSTQVGSGIYNTNGGVATVSGSTFFNNNGSGIFNDSTVPSMTTLAASNSTFTANDGGGIVNTGKMTVSNSTFSMNTTRIGRGI